MRLTIATHPMLDLGVFITEFPGTLGECPTPDEVVALLQLGAEAPLSSSDTIRSAVRDLLRVGGFKPTGRSKPASEYLLRAVAEGALASINWAVDTCNAVSLHSGLPISVVDLDRVIEPLRVAVAEKGAHYIFNASGQTIDVGGLLCLHDAHGPCANAVKDAQRTKTVPQSQRTLSLVWGTLQLGDYTQRTVQWYRELLERGGARTSDVARAGDLA